MILFLNIIACALIVIFCRYVLYRRNTILDLGFLFSITLLVNYPIRISTLYLFGDDATPSYYGLLDGIVLLKLSQIQFLGLLGFMAGYLMTVGNHQLELTDKRFLATRKRDILIICLLFFLSIIAKSYKIVTGDYISFLIGRDVNYRFANTIENIHNMGWICFAAVWVIFLLQKKKSLPFYLLFFAVNAVQISYQVIQGSKTFLLLPFLIIIFAIYYCKNRIPVIATMVVAIFAISFVFPFVTAFRENINIKYGDIPEFRKFQVAEFVSDLVEQNESKIRGDDSKVGILHTLRRFAGADELYNLDQIVPRVLPHRLGRDFYSILVTPIPRALWPDKPVFSPGADYGRILGTTTSVTPFPFGEMVWNFGVAGLFPAMMFWGFFLGQLMKIFNYIYVSASSPLFVLSIFLSELYWTTTGEAMLAILVSSLLKKAIIFFAIYKTLLFFASLILRSSNLRTHGIEA